VRRRNPGRVREALAAEYRRIAALYGWADNGWHGRFADRIETGEPVEVHGYEVGVPQVNHVRLESHGFVRPLDEGMAG
jgi:hypothetical protein